MIWHLEHAIDRQRAVTPAVAAHALVMASMRASLPGLMPRLRVSMLACIVLLGAWTAAPAYAQERVDESEVARLAATLQPKVVAWRRDIHAHPELGNREFRTARLIAEHLRGLGIEVRTGIAGTGVVGVLRGGQPGSGVIALRADMDALPVEERTGLPFASKVRTGGPEGDLPVMHACGHDAHVAMLMGAAELLSTMRSRIPGTIVFIFQPAEEGPPEGEAGGAPLMIERGALSAPKPSAIFGLHVMPGRSGTISFRSGGFFAGADRISIVLKGRQTHGAQPWSGIDVVALGADVVHAVNQIAARRIDPQRAPTIITLATVHAGLRHNIIPEELRMTGTLRTFDSQSRDFASAEVTRVVEELAKSYGATASVVFDQPDLPTRNDSRLAALLETSLRKAAGPDNVDPSAPVRTVSEDFSAFAQVVPGLFVVLGTTPAGIDPASAPANHSPQFDIDEQAMEVGVRAFAEVGIDYLQSVSTK